MTQQPPAYGAPGPGYGAPPPGAAPGYGPPGYGAPAPGYAPGYGAPPGPDGYAAPGYGGPQMQQPPYGAPPQNLGAPGYAPAPAQVSIRSRLPNKVFQIFLKLDFSLRLDALLDFFL